MFAGFALFGVEVGVAMAGLTLAAIVVAAALDKNDGTIEIATPGPGVPSGVLVVILAAIEEPRVAGVVAAIGDPSRPQSGDRGPLLVAPARSGLLDRWTGDLDRARFESQRLLTVSLATMAAAGIRAEGRVGDGDVVQATEDALRAYAATEVVVVAGSGEFERQITELERRLDRKLHRVVTESPDASLA